MTRIERKARNQALFREVNERIAEITADFEVSSAEGAAFVCECSTLGCTASILVPINEYERVRDDPTLFLVLRGHDDSDLELVVEDLGDYLVVGTKPGVATEVALEWAPGDHRAHIPGTPNTPDSRSHAG